MIPNPFYFSSSVDHSMSRNSDDSFYSLHHRQNRLCGKAGRL
ncbi:hypothetical protein HOLDEFILI_03982 [Holdemania filiformis DSM 12042]|uniref:Uncharacterized protein n=1 Tax=Holdemania filiformis DSM 12042 TaxID=545696 RepID=B9YDQ9_9FIRM|nr:hypothetical protein HOLDEFILI_03982 [Holdemania filiformis DSM 12042]